MTYYAVDRSGYISHHGILGMKWGVRRYQNADGSLTPAGKRRYGLVRMAADHSASYAKMYRRAAKAAPSEPDKYALKYMGSGKAKDRWLHEQYGDDYKDAKYMKDVFGITDLDRHWREETSSTYKHMLDSVPDKVKRNIELAKAYEHDAKRFSSLTIDTITSADIKDAKRTTGGIVGSLERLAYPDWYEQYLK